MLRQIIVPDTRFWHSSDVSGLERKEPVLHSQYGQHLDQCSNSQSAVPIKPVKSHWNGRSFSKLVLLGVGLHSPNTQADLNSLLISDDNQALLKVRTCRTCRTRYARSYFLLYLVRCGLNTSNRLHVIGERRF